MNSLYGVRYGTPWAPVRDAFEQDRFPVLDWPVDRNHLLQQALGEGLLCVYVEPPSLEALKARLSRDDRDPTGGRFDAAKAELLRLWRGEFDSLIDLRVVSAEGQDLKTARHIYAWYESRLRRKPRWAEPSLRKHGDKQFRLAQRLNW